MSDGKLQPASQPVSQPTSQPASTEFYSRRKGLNDSSQVVLRPAGPQPLSELQICCGLGATRGRGEGVESAVGLRWRISAWIQMT